VAGAAAGSAQRSVGGGARSTSLVYSVRADHFVSTFRAKKQFLEISLDSSLLRQAVSLAPRDWQLSPQADSLLYGSLSKSGRTQSTFDWVHSSGGCTEGLLGRWLAQRQAALRGSWRRGYGNQLPIPYVPFAYSALAVPLNGSGPFCFQILVQAICPTNFSLSWVG
jgi:hypothetical protein